MTKEQNLLKTIQFLILKSLFAFSTLNGKRREKAAKLKQGKCD